MKECLQEPDKGFFKQDTDDHHNDRPRNEIGGIQVELGIVKHPANGACGNANDFSGDASLPGQPKPHTTSREQKGSQLWQPEVENPPMPRNGKDIASFKQSKIGTFDALQNVEINHREDNQKRNENRQLLRRKPDEANDDKGGHRDGFDACCKGSKEDSDEGETTGKAAKDGAQKQR